MTEFDYEVKERKSLVASARHKKNGSKSRKCSLSTDYMKRKDWEKLNGEVISLNFNQPHGRKELEVLPVSLQQDYIKSLLERFNVSTRMLAEMFDCSQRAVYTYVEKIGLGALFTKSKTRPTSVQRLEWDIFVKKLCKLEDKIVEVTIEEKQKAVEENDKPIEEQPQKTNCKMLFPTSARLDYEGRLEDVCKALMFAIGPNTVGKFRIMFDIMEVAEGRFDG